MLIFYSEKLFLQIRVNGVCTTMHARGCKRHELEPSASPTKMTIGNKIIYTKMKTIQQLNTKNLFLKQAHYQIFIGSVSRSTS